MVQSASFTKFIGLILLSLPHFWVIEGLAQNHQQEQEKVGRMLEHTRLYYNLDHFKELLRTKTPHCFVENKGRLDFYLKDCDKFQNQPVHQSLKLSGPIKSSLTKDLENLEKSLLKNNVIRQEELLQLRELYKKDSAGQLVLMNLNGNDFPVGWISFDVDIQGNEKSYRILDLCSGIWSLVCHFNKDTKTFEASYFHKIYDEQFELTETKRLPILNVLYSAVFSRGNDDFVPLHYYNMAGSGTESDMTFAINEDWKDALIKHAPQRIDLSKRISQTPRTEPNYLTAFHPAYVVEVLNGHQKEIKLVFGAAVVYAKNSPAAQSCEDDTGAYKLIDFDESIQSKLKKPFDGREIEKLNLTQILKGQTHDIDHVYLTTYDEDDDNFEIPESPENPNYDLFNVGTSTDLIIGQSKQTKLVIKIDSRGKSDPGPYDDVLRSNAVREFLDITYDGNNWGLYLYAFNPNDPKNSNSVSQNGMYLSNDETILKTWNSKDGLSGKTQAFQRPLAMHLKKLEKRAFKDAEPKEWLLSLSKLSNDYPLDHFQINTSHAKYGVKGNYAFAFEHQIQEGSKTIKQSPIRMIVPRALPQSLWVEKEEYEKLTTEVTHAIVLEAFTTDRSKKLSETIDQVLKRIAIADNPVLQIQKEHQLSSEVQQQISMVIQFYSHLNTLKNQYLPDFNDSLKKAHRLPKSKRPKGYFKQTYIDDEIPGDKVLIFFSDRLMTLINNDKPYSLNPFFKKLEADLLQLKKMDDLYQKESKPANKEALKTALLKKSKETFLEYFKEIHFFEERYNLNIALRDLGVDIN